MSGARRWHGRCLASLLAMGNSFAALMLFASVITAPASAPREVVQSAVARVIAVIDGVEPDRSDRAERGVPNTERARAEIRRIANDLFDFDEMAKRTLSRHWTARTRAEQTEFVSLFTDLLERSYIGKIEAYAGEKIAYVSETIDGDYAVVRSKIASPRRRQDTALDYRLAQRDGRWRVYDVLIDGVSFVSTYRSEFNRVITGSSYRALVEALRAKRLQVKTVDRRG